MGEKNFSLKVTLAWSKKKKPKNEIPHNPPKGGNKKNEGKGLYLEKSYVPVLSWEEGPRGICEEDKTIQHKTGSRGSRLRSGPLLNTETKTKEKKEHHGEEGQRL